MQTDVAFITFYNIFPYHLYFWERVKGHWTWAIASNRDHIIIIATIDFNRYWVPTLFSHLATLLDIKDVVCYSTQHVKMDSASRVSLQANLARNASPGASRVSLDNKSRVEYSYASGTKYHQ